MPLPEPNSGEDRDAFLARCMGDDVMLSEYPEGAQRYRVCESQWENRSMTDEEKQRINDSFVDAFRERLISAGRKEIHGHGIRTADEYVKGVVETLDREAGDNAQLCNHVLKESQNRLTYANQDTAVGDVMLTSSSSMEEYCKARGQELPPRTLMVFEAVVTSPRKDRDGDILRTEGAIVDPKMPTLWHHMLPMPTGRMLGIIAHTKHRLKVSSTIMDSLLGLDSAHLVEHGALRISHGFRPMKFEALPTKNEDDFPGYDVKTFEVMEISLVTVPSNTDAVITAFSRGKLHDPCVKAMAKRLHDGRVVQSQGITLDVLTPTVEMKLKPVEIELPAIGGDGRPASSHGEDDWPAPMIAEVDRLYALLAKRQANVIGLKAGRVLSQKNETRLRSAMDAIMKAGQTIEAVLDQLPKDEEDKSNGSESTAAGAEGKETGTAATPAAGERQQILRQVSKLKLLGPSARQVPREAYNTLIDAIRLLWGLEKAPAKKIQIEDAVRDAVEKATKKTK